jgi:hypothetical protein
LICAIIANLFLIWKYFMRTKLMTKRHGKK